MTKKKTKRSFKITKKTVFETSIIAAVIAVGFVTAVYVVPAITNNVRKDRIVAIYDSLKLDDQKYLLSREFIFGDKRVYPYDSGRSYSSSRYYTRGATVSATVAELKQAVSKTDFKFIGEPYPGSTEFQYHYKSPAGEYLRISVDSKTRQDLFFNKSNMGLKWTAADFALDPNTGPSNVIIKVNLDDNNE